MAKGHYRRTRNGLVWVRPSGQVGRRRNTPSGVRGAKTVMNQKAKARGRGRGGTKRIGRNVYTRNRIRISEGQTRKQFQRQTRQRLKSMKNPTRRKAYRQRRKVLLRATH